MGIVGRFIDAGDNAAKDRVIEATVWINDNSRFVAEDDPFCRCLAGHQEDWYLDENGHSKFRGEKHRELTNNTFYRFAFNRFPQLCDRFGKDRIIHLCKMRAAKENQKLVEKIRSGIYTELKEARV